MRRGFARFGVFWVFLRSEIFCLAQEFALTPRNRVGCEVAQSGDSFCGGRGGGKVSSSFNLPKIGRWQSTMPNVASSTRRGQIQFVASNPVFAATLLTGFSCRFSAPPVGPRSQSLAWPTLRVLPRPRVGDRASRLAFRLAGAVTWRPGLVRLAWFGKPRASLRCALG